MWTRAIRVLVLSGAAVAAFAAVAAPTQSRPVATVVTLKAGAPTTPGKPVSFAASTTATLGGSGQLALELRGIDLTKKPRATYVRPDYSDKRCTVLPCRWSVTAGTATTYEFRACLVKVGSGAATSQSLPVQAVWGSAAPAPPVGLKLHFNGKTWPGVAIVGGADNYHDIAAGKMTVEARWQGNLKGSGYYVLIATIEPVARNYAVCSTGTSCRVPKPVALVPDQEVSWTAKLMTGKKLVRGFKVCLIGRA